MKRKINAFIDWFEDKFNFIIDTIALVGGTFMIIFSIVIFILLIIDATPILDIFEYIILPGVIGFFGILILFALRITRHLTKK
jgi:TRAP-type C4-dicarboxylate transport system permease small subunit